jgi:hypothetical protein
MRKILKWAEWKIDLYIAYFMYNPGKRYHYHRYMIKKWGDKYLNTFQ